MNSMKMSEHFPEAFQVDHNKSFEVQDAVWYSYGEKYESDCEQDSAIEHAVLNHDRMVEEIAELKEMLESVVDLQAKHYGNGMNTHLAMMSKSKEIKQLLNKND